LVLVEAVVLVVLVEKVLFVADVILSS